MKFRGRGFGFWHFLTFYTLAVSQPVFNLLGKNIEFFLSRESSLLEIGLYVAVVAAAIPAMLYAFSLALSALSQRLQPFIVATWVLLFCVLFVMLAAKNFGIADGGVSILIAIALGGLLALLYHRRTYFYRLMTYMVAIVILSPALLLWQSYQSLAVGVGGEVGEVQVARTDIPVFLMVLDELPLSSLLDKTGAIDALRYPGFARFSKVSTWYKNASAVADSTILAIPAILTGTRPQPSEEGSETSATAANYPRNLFTLLGQSHRIHADESVTRLCAKMRCNQSAGKQLGIATKTYSAVVDSAVVYAHQLLPASLVRHLPPINSTWGGFQRGVGKFPWEGLFFIPEQVDETLAIVSKATANDVHYIHLNLPHHPWIFYPSGKRYRSGYFAKDLTPLGVDWFHSDGHLWQNDEDLLAVSRQRQEMQIAYSDKIFSQYLDAIEASGQFDNALVILTADHGSNIAPGELFRWTQENNLEELMSIPLFVKYPQQRRAQQNLQNAESIDVLPTVVDILGIEHPWRFDGHSLRDLENKTTKTKTIMRKIPSTSSEANKERGFLLTTSSIDIFDRTWRDDATSERHRADPLYRFDRSYDKDWLGRRTSELETVSGERLAKVRALRRLKRVDLKDIFIPGYLRMSIPKERESESFKVLIALNGVIHATRFVGSGSTGQIDVVLPEGAFVQGKNDLAVYIAKGEEGDVLIEQLVLENVRRHEGSKTALSQ